ncbi:MAG: hypothetical protein JNM62_06510 [Flavobacteriales bacterium]|nr:hypothetical protein [Flavobacteriales bacterium]
MKHHYATFVSLLLSASTSLAQGGGCIPPTALFSTTDGDLARICQGDVVGVNADASSAAPGHTISSWIWHVAAERDTMEIALAVFSFADPGVYEISLEVIDEVGCSSGESDPVHVLVSATPDFTGTLVPALACEGQSVALQAVAQQPLMIGDAVACTPPTNGIPLIDDPAPSISLLQVSGQPNGVLSEIAALGDICVELEHSYVGDLVLTVACPNGQSVVLHEQGGGGTFLGDANDDDGSQIVPGGCFQYCFGLSPENGTLAASVGVNTVPVSQGTALAAGRYASVQPLTQLLGCPLNGTWTFSSSDMFGSDNGYLCGWCISFGEQPDSSFIDQGPVLGSSADSSYWSGPGITNGTDASAILDPVVGGQVLTYTVLDSYGCEHEASFPILVGATPQVEIIENTELGLVCAQPSGEFTYQWSYLNNVVVGAAGACFTPPGPGSVSVVVTSAEGCTGSASSVSTGVRMAGGASHGTVAVYPDPNDGTFTLRSVDMNARTPLLRLMDMTGRVVAEQRLSDLFAGAVVQVQFNVAPGTYLLDLSGNAMRWNHRIVVE